MRDALAAIDVDALTPRDALDTLYRLKAIADDNALDETDRLMARLKLAEIPRNGNPTRVRNRCMLTGRPRGVYRKFKLGRVMLRQLATRGMIPGVVKSSW